MIGNIVLLIIWKMIVTALRQGVRLRNGSLLRRLNRLLSPVII